VEAPSITKAYKEFERWMIMAFEASYAGGVVTHPAVVPSYYEGVSITKAVK
jgi:hypothetical protein